jgi:hypothetical protein
LWGQTFLSGRPDRNVWPHGQRPSANEGRLKTNASIAGRLLDGGHQVIQFFDGVSGVPASSQCQPPWMNLRDMPEFYRLIDYTGVARKLRKKTWIFANARQ